MSRERSLWLDLYSAGLVRSEQPPPVEGTPWYLQLMLGISAWMAAGFLLISFGALFQQMWSSTGGLLTIGALSCAVALGLLWYCDGPGGRDRVFLSQLALPISFTGQALLILGIMQLDDEHGIAGIGMAVLMVGGLMSAASRQPLHRFASSLTASFGFAMLAFNSARADLLAPVYGVLSAALWLAIVEPSATSRDEALRPIAYAASLSLLGAVWIVTYDLLWIALLPVDEAAARSTLLEPGWIVAAVWLAVVARLASRRAQAASLAAITVAIAVALVLAVLLHTAPGVLAALMLLLLAFAAGERFLLGLSIVGGLVYLGRYYFQLDLGLIDKAIVLATSGGVLLAMRAAIPLLWREKTA